MENEPVNAVEGEEDFEPTIEIKYHRLLNKHVDRAIQLDEVSTLFERAQVELQEMHAKLAQSLKRRKQLKRLNEALAEEVQRLKSEVNRLSAVASEAETESVEVLKLNDKLADEINKLTEENSRLRLQLAGKDNDLSSMQPEPVEDRFARKAK